MLFFYFLHHLHHRLFLCFCCPLNATGTTHTLRHFGVFRCVWFAFILLQLARYIKEKSIRFPRYLSPSLYILFSFSIVASFCFPLTKNLKYLSQFANETCFRLVTQFGVNRMGHCQSCQGDAVSFVKCPHKKERTLTATITLCSLILRSGHWFSL